MVNKMSDIFGVEAPLDAREKIFGALQADVNVLAKALAAANKILAEHGATAAVASMIVRQLKNGKTADNCRCLETEEVCSTIMVWDPSTNQYVEYTQCETRCIQWECDT